jgi:hypothetical protein
LIDYKPLVVQDSHVEAFSLDLITNGYEARLPLFIVRLNVRVVLEEEYQAAPGIPGDATKNSNISVILYRNRQKNVVTLNLEEFRPVIRQYGTPIERPFVLADEVIVT